MAITLELIQTLDAIDRNGSFEKAANELHKVRSALTYTIKTFETRFNVELFDRSKRRALLTETGHLLLDQGRILLRSQKQIEENIKLAATGWESVIRIAYDEKITLKPLLTLIQRFQSECPQIHIELYSEILGGTGEAIVTKKADIAIGLSWVIPDSSDIHFHPIGQSKFVFAIAPHHPLAKAKEPISQEILKQYPAIVARDSSSQRSNATSGILEEQNRIIFSTLEAKKQAQIEGLGVGFLPLNHIKEDIKAGRLIIKQVKTQKMAGITYIAWHKEKKGNAMKWFIKHITDKKFSESLL